MAKQSLLSRVITGKWFRFRIIGLFAVRALFAVWLSFYFSPFSPHKRADRALNKFKDSGAEVFYDYQVAPDNKNRYSHRIKPPGSELGRKVIGESFFQNAVSLSLYDSPLNAADLEPLRNLTLVRNVDFGNCEIGDDHIIHIAALPLIDSVTLRNNRITDEGLSRLRDSQQLELLVLSNNKITGTGFKGFKTPKLTTLFMYENPISDEGLEQIGKLTSLKMLGIAKTKTFTDAGLSHLSQLKKLTYLCLIDNAITDDGLKHLSNLPMLNDLEMVGTKVTKTGIAKFKKTHPNCRVIY